VKVGMAKCSGTITHGLAEKPDDFKVTIK